jgi:hypothetical protein
VLDAIARRFTDPQRYYRLSDAPLSIEPHELNYFFTSSETQDLELQDSYKRLIKKHREAIAYHFLCSMLRLYIMDVVEGQRDHLRHAEVFGGAEVVNSYILRAANTIGLSSVEEFFARYKATISPSWRDQWQKDKAVIQQDAMHGVDEYLKEWQQIIDLHFFGFPLSKNINELKQLTVEKNIPHKDFADRNIMIEWDFDENRPLVREGATEPRVLLIDWEEE